MRARAGKVSQPPVLMVDSAMASPNRISLNWPDNQSGGIVDRTVFPHLRDGSGHRIHII